MIATNRKRKRGRPRVDSSPVVVRMRTAEIAAVDRWIESHAPHVTRPQAIRRLIELGLGRSKPMARRSRKSAAQAVTMAGKAIDRAADLLATPAERAKRKRRLIKGPTEFRGMRKD